jgi:hypothetical protein
MLNIYFDMYPPYRINDKEGIFYPFIGEKKFNCYNKHDIQLSCLVWYDTYGV